MKRLIPSIAWVAGVMAALSAVGCVPSSTTKSTAPAVVPSRPEPAPAVAEAVTPTSPDTSSKPTALTRVQVGAYSLPGMDCLVNEAGIRVKVLITRPGVRCLDRVPNGEPSNLPLQYFRPYFVFDVYPRSGDVQFYQIGATPRRDSISGWVPITEVTPWPTRIGLRYRRANGERLLPLLVFPTKEAVLEFLRTGGSGVEPIATNRPGAPRTFMPWPASEVHHVTVNGQVHEIVKLNVLGELPTDSAVAVAPPVYSPDELRRVRTGLRQLDLVIAIDVTGSMQPYLDAATESIRDLTHRLRELDFQPDVAVGLVAYRDRDTSSGFVTKHFDLEADPEKFLARIADLKAEAGGDIPESVYDGVYEAMEKTSWRGQGLSARVVVLIGDASAHEPGDPQNPRNISRDQLVELAKKRNVKLFALPVGARATTADRELMWKQFTDLATRTQGECLPLASAAVVVERVKQIMRTETKEIDTRARVFDDLAEGKDAATIAAARDLDIRKVTEVLEFLKSAGVKLPHLKPGVPTFTTGWALCEVHGVPVLDREVYLARGELDMLLAALNLLSARLSPDFSRRVFKLGFEGREGLIASYFEGDGPEPLDVFLMAKQIPVGRSSILRLSPADIRHMSEERRAQLRQRLIRQIIPALVNARTDDSLWQNRDDLDFGWLPENILP